MRRLVYILCFLTVALNTGCSSTPERERIDATKAAEANAVLGLRYMQQGNYEVALNKLKKALHFDDSYGPAHHYIAELYRRLERYEDADKHFKKALSYIPEDSSLHNNYGVFLCSQDRYDEGEKQFLKVLANPVHPQRERVYENLALCVERKPNLIRTEEYLKSALRINPRLPKSLLAMSRVQFAKGRYLSARAFLQRYLEVAKHTAESLWLGIRIERLLGDSNAVSSYGLLLKANFPASEEAQLYLESEQGNE